MPATKADQIAEPRVCADGNAQAFRLLDRAAHGARVTCVKTGRNIGGADKGHQFSIDAVTNGPRAKAFTHVRVEIHLHGCCSCGCPDKGLSGFMQSTLNSVAPLG